ncbi:MAG: ribosomal protein S18-alanine N-acetyltransferase [Bowdeniella nasicola]|nr:ribosomal protein S18-alanine N-acetyltransferase [Bowdeniella nasicola]
MRVIFAPLRECHLDAVLALEDELFGDQAWSEALYRADLKRTDRAWRGLFSPAGELVGYAGMYIAPQADLLTIGIGKAYQSRGYGKLLLSKMHALAKQLRVIELFLEVRLDNTPARHLYRTFGYEELGVRRHYYGRGVHAMVMRVRLADAPPGPIGAEIIM